MATITIAQSLSGSIDGTPQTMSSAIRQEIRTAILSDVDATASWRTVFVSTDTKQNCFVILQNAGLNDAVYRVSQVGDTSFAYFDLPSGRAVVLAWDASQPFALETSTDIGSVQIEVYSASGTKIRFLTAQ